MIKKVIVEDCRGVTISSNSLIKQITAQELLASFEKEKIPISNVSIDSVGTATITCQKRFSSSYY